VTGAPGTTGALGAPAAHGAGAVFLLTDYGTTDEFAGVLRAVVARDAPGAPLVDLTHDVPPFDVRSGSHTLARAVPHLGPGVVLAVVDPGVGTPRRPVAVEAGRSPGPRYLVGPDNGLLAAAVELLGGATAAVLLARRSEASRTFDGRDVFAPAAAALWRGVPLAELGSPLDPGSLQQLPAPVHQSGAGRLSAEVLWVDRFGNVQLASVAADAAAAGLDRGAALVVETDAGTWRARRVDSFAEAGAEGEDLGVLVDANDHVAVVCNRRSAATVLAVGSGDVVTIRLAADGERAAVPTPRHGP
jgi:S-adenosylmethionine hydrolase